MDFEITPGAQRALVAARQWAGRDDSDELAAVAILLGLLAESECRAASILGRHGIDETAVRRHWPGLPADPWAVSDQFTPLRPIERAVLEAATARLQDYPQPLELATEHILLGLAAAAPSQVAGWLQDQGLRLSPLEAEIHKVYRHHAGPLSFEPKPTLLASQLHEPPPEPGAKGGGAAASEIGVLRVLDAAANRAREGLRVVEDYVRFVLDDSHLTGLLKRLRHDLAAALADVPIDHRLAARETTADVGTGLTTTGEQHREDDAAVLTANFSRLQEALRSLEEVGKVRGGVLAAAAKQIRYRVYTLQRAVHGTRASRERLSGARLYVLIDGRPSLEQFDTLVRTLASAGVHVLQLRDKQLDDRGLLERARRLRSLCDESGVLMVVNDRPDIAALARADGVHVGQEELSVKDTRTIVGPGMLVGVSTHSIEQARRAVLDGADYIGLGPTFPSGTKHFEHFPGLDLVRAVAAEIRLPAFAIGGINQSNLAEVRAAGSERVAVSGAVIGAADPAAKVRELLAGL